MMCLSKSKSASAASTVQEEDTEVIKSAVQADASVQKASAENRSAKSAIVSENIKTSATGVDDDVVTSRKKLLGE